MTYWFLNRRQFITRFTRTTMSIRIKCSCGQLLNVPDSSGGKKVRCPSCQLVIQVPVVPTPAKPVIDPFADIPLAQTNRGPLGAVSRPLQAQRTIPRRPTASSDGGKTVKVAALVGGILVGVISLSGAAVWLLMPWFGDSRRVEDNFTPLEAAASSSSIAASKPIDAPEGKPAGSAALAGRNDNESAMLAVAEQFLKHARQNEHHEAIAMIDAKLFHTRLYSAKGSYEAMTNDIPATKLLSNLGGYALDGAPVGGRRHWQVIGTSAFDGNPGVVLRYYVEPQSPLQAMTDPKLFNRLGAMVTYDQISQKAGNLFTGDGQKTSLFDRLDLSSHAIRKAFPSRAGYMMLVFDCQEATPRLVDLVNVLGQAPLSLTGAHVFLADYRMSGGYGAREKYGTKPSTISVYGISDGTSGATWDANDPGGEQRVKQKAAEEAAAVEQKRPRRLEKLVESWRQGEPSLNAELSAFRSDFPNDLGFELAIVLHKMASAAPTFTPADDALIVPATRALYKQWRDPFFLYVEAICAQRNGRQADADSLFAKCTTAGFATTEYFITRVQSAVDRTDTAAIVATLEEWNRAAAKDGSVPMPERLEKLARSYEELDRTLNPQPTVGEMMAGGMRGPTGGMRGPAGSRGGRLGFANERFNASPDMANPSDQPFGGGAPPQSSGSPFPQRDGMPPRPGFGAGPSKPPELSGQQVVIKITSSRGFDGNQILTTLGKKLGTQNYNFSQSNQTATFNLSFAGPFQDVVKAIDFGTIDATDEATRTITVTIP